MKVYINMKTIGINNICSKKVQKAWAKWLKDNNETKRHLLRDEYCPKYNHLIIGENNKKNRNMFKIIPLMEQKDLVDLYIKILENNKN